MLPWGLPLIIDTRDNICEDIWLHGVYDLGLTEALWRLSSPGDVIIDVGANIGYTASIFCARVGRSGQVYAFEPHPTVFRMMQRNIDRWQSYPDAPQIIAWQLGVSDRDRRGFLQIPAYFDRNNGTSTVIEDGVQTQTDTIEITLTRLDSLIPNAAPISLLKVDVEGHEIKVFAGMGNLLGSQLVRNIVFEETSAYPAATHKLLESAGYSLFAFETTVWGLRLVAPSHAIRPSNFAPNYIATCEPQRLQKVFGSNGWRCLALRFPF
jgi:FkbM family methyltransferase